jgi:hypothetical protein
LGHESIQTTGDTYGHLLPDAQLLAAAAASVVFGGRISDAATTRVEAMGDDALRELAAAITAEINRRGLALVIEAGSSAA